MPKRHQPMKISNRLLIITGIFLVLTCGIIVVLVNYSMRQQALVEAQSKMAIMAEQYLAIHTYFTQKLKPAIFELTDPVRTKSYFDPVWMSSTYAIREMNRYIKTSKGGAEYYLKDAAINARSPENEATAYEKEFLSESGVNPTLKEKSSVQMIDGRPYLVFLRRGEMMEKACLRCHGSPDRAPGDMVRLYGPERAFNRKIGDLVQVISIRVPLAEAYANANRFSLRLSALLLALIFALFGILYLFSRRLIFEPLSLICNTAHEISADDKKLGDEIPLPSGRELNELAMAFNSMSKSLRYHLDNLEALVKDRTSELTQVNEDLKIEISTRKEIEQQLRESEEKFKNLFDNMDSGVAVYEACENGEDFIFQDFNKAAERIDRISREDVIGKSVLNIFPGVKEFGLIDVFQRVWKTGKREQHHIALYKDDRITGWRDNFVYKLPSGQIVSVYADETERKRAEEALRESEERYRTLIDNLPVAVYRNTPGPEGEFLMANPAFCKMFGYQNEEEVKQVTPASFYQDPRERQEYSDNLIQKGIVVDEERTLLRRDGTPVHTSITSRVVYGKEGQVAYFDSIMLDITDRKRAEKALRESEKRYRHLFESESDALFFMDKAGHILEANRAAVDLFGYSREDLLAMRLTDLSAEPEKTREAIEKDATLIPRRFYHKKDGTVFPVEIVGSNFFWEDKRVHIAAVRDITWRRKAEEEKGILEAQLRQAQKMEAISTLAGGIAHDFNNILSAIMGYGQLAQMKLDPESEPYADLKEVLQSADRARLLIRQILAVGRDQEQERQPMQLKYIVKEVIKFLRSTLPSSIEIRDTYDKDVGIIDADPTQMHQVLMNLCTNAGHAMEQSGGILEVSLQNAKLGMRDAPLNLEPGWYLKLTVSDTGHGMTPEVMEKIFDPYFTTKEKREGTGIGLSVVHGILSQHGGAITVESEPGKGSTFHVYLPLTQAEEQQPEVEETPVPTGGERILFIDDEAALARMGKQMLQRLGYHVTSMTSSTEALTLFKEQPKQFDLVITDTTMPHMPGDTLAQEMMKIRPDIPIIICTGHSKRISRDRAKEMGIKAFLMKPLAMQDLAKMVRKLLDEE